MEALSGIPKPKDSTMAAMVDAVPIGAQCPMDLDIAASAATKSSSDNSPFLYCSANLQTSEVPIFLPLNQPANIGPPETTKVGKLTLAAPITKEGVVLSQPQRSTTPSIGFALILSSTSMLARLRKSIAVGLMEHSPRDITGNSRGKPPASQIPRFTASANSRKWALQGVSSE